MKDPLPLKPWWKSAGFWLGAVVAVFLGWVMVDSARYLTSLHHASSSTIEAVQIGGGSLAWLEIENLVRHSLGEGWSISRTLRVDQDLENSPGILGRWCWNELESIYFARFTTRVSVPVWFFFFAWLAFWFGGMAWWRRRARRLPDDKVREPHSGAGA